MLAAGPDVPSPAAPGRSSSAGTVTLARLDRHRDRVGGVAGLEGGDADLHERVDGERGLVGAGRVGHFSMRIERIWTVAPAMGRLVSALTT